MKSLNIYITEGLADWGEDDKLNKKISKQTTKAAIKQEIIDWLKTNTKSIQENKLKFDFNTTPITVDYDDDVDFKTNITSLTNGMFHWGKVGNDFDCSYCKSLKSLEGASKEVGISFYCYNCDSLKTLEGAPKKVGEFFSCNNCKSLKSLEGAPKEVGKEFYCLNCGTQFTEKDVKKVCKVKGKIYC